MPEKRLPVIGIPALWNAEKGRSWMLSEYAAFVRSAGAVPVVLPIGAGVGELTALASLCDGLLIPGGQDVDPALYGEEDRACGPLSAERDALELPLLRMFLEADKPILGICRGLQLLNAYLGGTLWQDLPSERPGSLRHRMEKPYEADAHLCTAAPESPLAELLGTESFSVNTLHHQAVRELSPSLRLAATAEDGVIEAAWMPGKRFVLGVQWHPEYRPQDENSRKLAAAFAAACRK